MSKTSSSFSSLHLSILFFCFITLPFSVFPQHINQERAILLKLRQQWNNPPSIKSWNTSIQPDHCKWLGIGCTEGGSVWELSLNHMNIVTDKMSESICQLKNLTNISLRNNLITSVFPTVLYNCTQLINLDLSDNKFHGPIPKDVNRISTVEFLDLSMNQFSGDVPVSLGSLSALKLLDLSHNRFNGSLPPEIGNLSNLEVLQISYNVFIPWRIPREFGQLRKLIYLLMAETQLTGEIPFEIGELFNLARLDLSMNKLTGTIPRSMFLLEYLTTLYLSYNLLSGELPDTLPPYLSRLEICNNRLSGRIPSNIRASKFLKVFNASDNLFSGEIPMQLTALSYLETLALDGNRLSGYIPVRIICWESLATLVLSRNQLSGEIPSEIGLLPNVNVLDLSNNQLTGSVPLEISCMKLTFLNLSSNKLTGRLPARSDSYLHVQDQKLCTRKFVTKCCDTELCDSKGLPTRFLAMILALSGAVLLVLGLFSFLRARQIRRRKRGEDLAPYMLTSFQRVEFTQSTILSNLTENNLIGSGGSGKVYRVSIDHQSNKYVAVKMIWGKGNLEKQLVKQYLAEIDILGTIRHSNIVKLLCYISNGKSHFLVYEYTENQSLDQWLHVRRMGSLISGAVHHTVLEWPKRMQIAVGAAQGLSYMHHNCFPPIIHRDVKSSNILLDSEFNAKITDFGLARMLANTGETDTMSSVAGSFGYMAPEYAHTSRANEKIDVYSFGVVLLELVTGREATEGDEYTNLAQWARRHFQDGKTIESALDENAKEPTYVEEMSMVFKLGLMCTETLPSTRPSMKEVLQILLTKCTMRFSWSELYDRSE